MSKLTLRNLSKTTELVMLTIYGTRPSRVVRCLWALEELQLPYLQVAVPGHRPAAFLRLNPLGKVPVLEDGDFVMTESVAINFYLAGLQATPLYPDDLRTRARIEQWTSWAITEVEFHFTTMVRELRRAGAAGEQPNVSMIDDCLAGVVEAFAPLEAHLAAGNDYVAGADFTIGDVNACFPVAGIAPRMDMTRFPAISAWVTRCTTRDGWQRVQAIDETGLASV